MRESHFTWRERAEVDGVLRLPVARSDPMEHEHAADGLFDTEEQAREWKDEFAPEEDWVLCVETLERVGEGKLAEQSRRAWTDREGIRARAERLERVLETPSVRAADVMAKLTELRGLADELKKVFGYGEADLSIEDAIASAQRMYDVFHVVVASRSYAPASSMDRWRELLGEKVLVLEAYKALAELIVTTIALCRGMSAADATKGFTSKVTDMVLRSGVDALARSGDGGSSEIATL